MARLVTNYLEDSAKNYPNKVAFVDQKREITFKQLQNESKAIAQTIIEKNIFKQPVAVFLDKSVECVAAFMGTAYSGNFYTPIDVKMPINRIEKIIQTLNPVVIITDKSHYETALKFSEKDCLILIYEDCQNNEIDTNKIKDIEDKLIDTDLLYVLFTSGSTGTPKGVIINHKALITYIEWVSETFDISDKTIFGSQTPFYFSMSVLDIFSTIKNASTFYIIPKMYFSFPIKLMEFIRDKKINTLYWVPTALCIIANYEALGEVDISCVKKILFAGEVMPTKQLNMWIKTLPDTMFANLYGPTEVTDISNYWIVNRKLLDTEAIPIGNACKNTGIIILNEKDEEVKENEMGELCIRGSELALGYYNNPQKTKEVFVQNPLNKLYPEIIYRTGDLVRYNDNGELVYVCRKDFQIKHMGHRIELGEIETALSAIQGIEQSCCLYDTEKSQIVIFYTGNVEENFIITELKNSLPAYMMPNKRVQLDRMPINLNGKIDRIELKKMF